MSTTLLHTVANRAEERKTLAGTIFSTAISVIRRKGWVQGDWHQEKTGAVCLMGAIEDAMAKVLGLDVATPAELRSATNAVAHYLRESYGSELFDTEYQDSDGFTTTSNGQPETWNDAPGRKVEEVISALETVAAREASTPFDHLIKEYLSQY